ncbi:hypothetical protein ACFVS2_26160 [Brevibacillus sp. NPDC058079]|uniref:hypothetical protein n=1 Tax=Brevibacillus sp. NPDC058079 TaxID=3346330 RepID=UPI0036E8F92D
MRAIEGKVFVTDVDGSDIGDVDAGAGQDSLCNTLALEEYKGTWVRVTIEVIEKP